MKLMLICAGGMSTSILMKKMEKYAEEKGIPLEKIQARSASGCEEDAAEYDAILLGPQVSYQKESIAQKTGKPVAVIAPYDYAIGNVENIFAEINKLLAK
ncbi:MAG: PTS sugar transporter subunit IIB [Oscillospiraceae bacterium]|nr:PTS sugar transporter subunit IIB [Oscillospiraceae bacterium]